MTRAEWKLYLTFAHRRRRGGEWMDSIPSSFLEGVPKELLEIRQSSRVRDRFTPSRSWRSQGGGGLSQQRRSVRLGLAPPPEEGTHTVDYSDSQDMPRLIRGARVRHPQFGGGTVLELSGFRNDMRATIEFDSVGRKTVVVKYANLQPDWD